MLFSYKCIKDQCERAYLSAIHWKLNIFLEITLVFFSPQIKLVFAWLCSFAFQIIFVTLNPSKLNRKGWLLQIFLDFWKFFVKKVLLARNLNSFILRLLKKCFALWLPVRYRPSTARLQARQLENSPWRNQVTFHTLLTKYLNSLFIIQKVFIWVFFVWFCLLASQIIFLAFILFAKSLDL